MKLSASLLVVRTGLRYRAGWLPRAQRSLDALVRDISVSSRRWALARVYTLDGWLDPRLRRWAANRLEVGYALKEQKPPSGKVRAFPAEGQRVARVSMARMMATEGRAAAAKILRDGHSVSLGDSASLFGATDSLQRWRSFHISFRPKRRREKKNALERVESWITQAYKGLPREEGPDDFEVSSFLCRGCERWGASLVSTKGFQLPVIKIVQRLPKKVGTTLVPAGTRYALQVTDRCNQVALNKLVTHLRTLARVPSGWYVPDSMCPRCWLRLRWWDKWFPNCETLDDAYNLYQARLNEEARLEVERKRAFLRERSQVPPPPQKTKPGRGRGRRI